MDRAAAENADDQLLSTSTTHQPLQQVKSTLCHIRPTLSPQALYFFVVIRPLRHKNMHYCLKHHVGVLQVKVLGERGHFLSEGLGTILFVCTSVRVQLTENSCSEFTVLSDVRPEYLMSPC